MPHNYVGCEHLLLGLIAKPDGLAESVLRQMGLELPVTRWAAQYSPRRLDPHSDHQSPDTSKTGPHRRLPGAPRRDRGSTPSLTRPRTRTHVAYARCVGIAPAGAGHQSGRQPRESVWFGAALVVAEVPEVRVLLMDNVTARGDVMQTVINAVAVGAVVVPRATDGESALAAAEATEPDVAVQEIQLPVDVGIELLEALHRQLPKLPIVVCSFRTDSDTQAQAIAHGARRYVEKPVSAVDLNTAIAACSRGARAATPLA